MEKISPVQSETLPVRPKILIVEDEPTQRLIWKRILQIVVKDAELHWADSYLTAASALEKGKKDLDGFDLLITDIFLNGKQTGFELCKNFFKSVKGHVILVSDFGEIETPQKNSFQVDGKQPLYLRKPIAIDETITMIRKLLSARVI